MPQLEVATYPSQVFWVLVGFTLVYLFVSRVAVPGLQEIIRSRTTYVESILRSAEKLKTEADRIQTESRIALEEVQLEASAEEQKLVFDFKQKSLAERNAFCERLEKESQEKSMALTDAANEVFSIIAASSDELVDQAINVMSGVDGHEH